ncbi:CHY zinc finger protein [Rothia sp. HC945]|uniref:CHY zinc finger protein n=1 Tax=Rothia sp. HC945 TaxID=3171170 RepID=UPI002651D7C5|nr:CHY zinc finger protein [Kocuria sp.]MDN5617810.1 CHY zinc finger protein [Kocuria sp.]MDN5654789.1 CHY zinc finger protein [Kocuria sp.]
MPISRNPGLPRVWGDTVDDMTRCVHYHQPEDVVAIRFKCCNRYYPCHLCHAEAEDHEARQWPIDERETRAILCGGCGSELPIREYMAASRCPRCAIMFNERCSLHYDLYFDVD